MNLLSLSLLPLALLPLAALAQPSSPTGDIEARLLGAGYLEVRELELDDGLWEADARRADGRWSEVVVDPASGEVFDSQDGRAMLASADLIAALDAGGYREITDLERDGALWDVEARDSAGERVELRVSGIDGRVLHRQTDRD